MSHNMHYRLTCPTCQVVTESCGCSMSWHNSWPARIPCKVCTAKLAITKDAHAPPLLHGGQQGGRRPR